MEPFIERDLPILIVTSRKNTRTLDLLRTVRYDGIYDDRAEGLTNLRTAVQCVLERQLYVSPSFAPHLKKPKNITLDTLTEKEQMVLAVIGDGSDDNQAAERLKISSHTVNTHRKSIMAKLKLHHKGQIMMYAFVHGYVHVTPGGISLPGFQRKIRNLTMTS
ncbi:MAG: LuxR C-terminal-related transcriptional regulator [Nibricoccus sp.]